jgi:hypothetical protein
MYRFALLTLICAPPCMCIFAQSTQASATTYVIENYYRVKWGHQQEFIDLYKENHYPIVKRMQGLGFIEEITIEKPHFHSPEPDRWDYRVRLTFPTLEAAFEEEKWDEVSRQLYPDRDKLAEDEQRRFGLLLAHWDILIVPEDLEN